MISVDGKCGGEIFVQSGGHIQSPDHPHYPLKNECIWILTAPEPFTLITGFKTFQVKKREETCSFCFKIH